jgi:hypothetical protein
MVSQEDLIFSMHGAAVTWLHFLLQQKKINQVDGQIAVLFSHGTTLVKAIKE